MMGAVIARWLESRNDEMLDGKKIWNVNEGVARWSGWAWSLKAVDGRDQVSKGPIKSGRQTSQRMCRRNFEDDGKKKRSKNARKAG